MSPVNVRLQIQAELDALKTQLERNVLGQFATPPSLARQIVRATLPFLPDGEPIRFLEPALGTGSFFEALGEAAEDRLASAVGVEIDPAFARASRGIWAHQPITIVEADFTTLDPAALGIPANLLITNPPYVRHHHIPAEKKQHLVRLSARSSGTQPSGLAGLYIHFMLIAHQWLAPGAVCAWLIPSEFMDVNYGAELKQYLAQSVDLLRIHRFEPEDVQFDDALVTSTVVIFRNALPKSDHRLTFSIGGSMELPRETKTVSLADLQSLRKWSSLSREAELHEKSILTLGDAFVIRRGLATGDNKFFIRQLEEFVQQDIPLEFLKPVLPSPRNVRELLIEGGEDGFPILDRKLALFDCPLAETELKRQFPAVWAFVQKGKERKVHEGYLCKARSPWYSQERREPPPLLCTYMGRAKPGQPPFRIIRNKSLAIATNVYLLLYPKPWLEKADYDGRLLDRIAVALQELRANTFTAEGRVYGGGLHKMEPKELARIPLNLDELAVERRHVVQDVLFEKRARYGVKLASCRLRNEKDAFA